MAWDLKAQRSTHIRGCRKQRAAVDLSLWAFVAAPVLQRCLATRNPMSLEIPDNFDATLGGSGLLGQGLRRGSGAEATSIG